MLSALAADGFAQTPPGTLIVNVASVEYSSGPGGGTTLVESNPVVTSVIASARLQLVKSAEPGGTVPPGTAMDFRLLVDNTTGGDLVNVVVADVLDPLLGAPAAVASGPLPDLAAPGSLIDVAGAYDGLSRTVSWSIPLVPDGSRIELSFIAAIDPAAPDDSIVRNVATQRSDQDPAGTSSNEIAIGVVSPALSIRTQASRPSAEVGDPVGFTVEVANVSPTLNLTSLQVRDRIPEGFRYRAGSAKLDGRPLQDPAGSGPSRHLLFPLGDLPVGGKRRLTFVAVPGPAAEGRDAVSRAWSDATSPAGSTVSAGPAQAQLRVDGSLFSGEGVILGRVFVDDDRNGRYDDGEVGVPAARVYLEDGTFAITDVVGKYHFEGVRPGLHVLKVDAATMPDGLGPLVSWSRSAGGAGTQFVDLGPDQVFKSNVASAGWGLSVARLAALAVYRADDDREHAVAFPPLLASSLFEPDGSRMHRAAKPVLEGYAALIRERGGRMMSIEVEPSFYPLGDESLMRSRADRLRLELGRLVMASGTRTPGGPGVARKRPGDGDPAGAPDAPESIRVDRMVDGAAIGREGTAPQSVESAALEERVRRMDAEPAILVPGDGEALLSEVGFVEVKLPVGLRPRLTVNGTEIGIDRIAVRMETSGTRLVFYRYLGIRFNEGRNAVALEGIDQWGNARAWVERIVDRVGGPARLSLTPDDGSLKADGRTSAAVRVDVRDAGGLAVLDGTMVTLAVDTGEFVGTDADPRREGFQAATRDGQTIVHLQPAADRLTRTVTAKAGPAEGEVSLALGPETRDWIVAGVGEATVGQKGLGSGADLDDLLEDGAGADGRLALFARGRLFGSSLMTLAYDSDRERDRDQVFRALAPDRFFPIYGDSSAQGYDVEGQGRFSMRLDQPRSSLVLGDFTTGLTGGDLLRYDRALTGGAGHVDLHGFTLQSFGATTPQTQIRDEIEGAGVSGPYRLSRAPVVINSERVILETRDRFQPDRVLSSTGMARFTDYDVDYRNGTLLFKRPVAFQDDSFNPVVLVVIYETLDGDGNQTVAGGRAGYRFGDTGEIGMTYVNEDRTSGAFVLRGADFRVRRAFGSSSMDFSGEAAASESAAGEPAGAVAFRASASLGRAMTIGAHYRNVASGFENPSRAGLPDAGTIRWGLEATASLAGGSRLKGELYSQQDEVRGQDRRVAAVDWERPIGRFTARSGLKDLHALDPASGRVESSRLISAGAGFRIGRRLEGLLARQQVVSGPALAEYPTRTSVGLGWQVTEEVRAFLRQELDQADAGSSARTVIGMESRLTRHTVMESRYSIEDALSGSRGAAHLSLRTRLPLNQDWLGDAGIERVATAHGLSTADFTSLGIGFEYLPARVKFTTRYELRLGTLDDRHVLTLGGATRVTDSLSLFARQRLFVVNPADSGARFDGDGLVGLAYRPVEDDRLNFLVKLQGLKGDGALSAGSPGARSYLGVFEANYQPVPRLHLMARTAIKQSRDVFEGDSYTSSSRLLEGRLLYDIRTRYNAGLSVRRLDQPGSGSIVTGFGIEGGYNLVRDLWFVGGFNVTGFAESGFGDSDRRAAGPFLTVRFKFDEESLVGLAGRFSSTPDAGGKAAGPRRLR